DRLQSALADLRLVRRVGSVKLRARDQRVNDGRNEMVVSARAQKRDHPLARVARGVALSQVAEEINSFGFGKGRGQVERAFELEPVWDSTKKIGDGFAAHFAQHRFTLFGRIRNVTHRISGSGQWVVGSGQWGVQALTLPLPTAHYPLPTAISSSF